MQSAHILIWAAILVVVVMVWVTLSAINRTLKELRVGLATTQKELDQIDASLKALQSWSASFVAFHENVSRQYSNRTDDINRRLIQLETQNKTLDPVKKEDDDPYSGPRSWAAQSAAASRGLGVEIA